MCFGRTTVPGTWTRPLPNSTGATAGLEVLEHMKTRVLSAVALLPLLLVIVLVLPAWATAALFGAAAGGGRL